MPHQYAHSPDAGIEAIMTVDSFSSLLKYGALRKSGEHSSSQSCSWLLLQATFMFLSCSPNFRLTPQLNSAGYSMNLHCYYQLLSHIHVFYSTTCKQVKLHCTEVLLTGKDISHRNCRKNDHSLPLLHPLTQIGSTHKETWLQGSVCLSPIQDNLAFFSLK